VHYEGTSAPVRDLCEAYEKAFDCIVLGKAKTLGWSLGVSIIKAWSESNMVEVAGISLFGMLFE